MPRSTESPHTDLASGSHHQGFRHGGFWLSSEIVTGLWVLCMLNLTYGAWLLAVRYGQAPCSGTLCTVATVGGHEVLALVLAEGCAAVLVVAMPVNRGPAMVGGLRLATIVVATLCGAIALAGVAVLVAAFAMALILAAGVVLYVVDRL